MVAVGGEEVYRQRFFFSDKTNLKIKSMNHHEKISITYNIVILILVLGVIFSLAHITMIWSEKQAVVDCYMEQEAYNREVERWKNLMIAGFVEEQPQRSQMLIWCENLK